MVRSGLPRFEVMWLSNITKGAGSLGVQPEVKSADAKGVLVGCLLFFDVLPQDVNRRTEVCVNHGHHEFKRMLASAVQIPSQMPPAQGHSVGNGGAGGYKIPRYIP